MPTRSAPKPTGADLLRGTGPALSEEQAAAVDAIDAAHGRFAPFLLYGITGSGKTEVYLHTVEHALRRSQRALVLVPEIGLTPQLVGRFRERFAVPVALLHSALTDTERLAAWRQCVSGEARIVLGTRSAVFAPIAESRPHHRRRGTRRLVQAARERLPLFGARPRHPARAARRRARRARLGDAFARDPAERRERKIHAPVAAAARRPGAAAARRGHRPARARGARRASPRRPSRPCSAISPTTGRCWCTSTGAATRRRSPATACGWIAPCRDCDARLTVHLGAARLRCHHCGADAPLPEKCPQCGYARQTRRPGHGARRGDADEAVSRHAHRAARSRRGAQARRPRSGGRPHRQRRGAHPGRHADGDQGARFSERHAGGGAERRPGPVQHRLSRARTRGADHHPGRRPRRAAARNPAKC